MVLRQVTIAVQEQYGDRKYRHACIFGPNFQYHSIAEAICATQFHLCSKALGPQMMRSSGLQGHHGLQSNHYACWLTATFNTEAPGGGLQQGISVICKHHVLSGTLGCQCKWYLRMSPLLSWSTAVLGTIALLLFSSAMVYGSTGPNLMQSVRWLSAVQQCLGVQKHLVQT